MWRLLFNTSGLVCVALGFAGVLLPVLPTTPFLLLGGWCFARGNPRLGERLLSHRVFRPYRRYLDGSEPIPVRVRGYTLALVWPVVALSAWLVRSRPWLVGLLLLLAVIGSLFILRFRRCVVAAGPASSRRPAAPGR